MEMEGVGCVLSLLGDGQAIEGANQAEAGEVNVGGDLRGRRRGGCVRGFSRSLGCRWVGGCHP